MKSESSKFDNKIRQKVFWTQSGGESRLRTENLSAPGLLGQKIQKSQKIQKIFSRTAGLRSSPALTGAPVRTQTRGIATKSGVQA